MATLTEDNRWVGPRERAERSLANRWKRGFILSVCKLRFRACTTQINARPAIWRKDEALDSLIATAWHDSTQTRIQ